MNVWDAVGFKAFESLNELLEARLDAAHLGGGTIHVRLRGSERM